MALHSNHFQSLAAADFDGDLVTDLLLIEESTLSVCYGMRNHLSYGDCQSVTDDARQTFLFE